MRLRTHFSLFLLLCLVATTVSAQQTPDNKDQKDQTATFSKTTGLVLIPVVVTGKDGRPVHGLKKEAFQVSENGSPRPVTTFEEVNTNEQALQRPKDPNQFTNAIGGATEPRRITIILLDALNTPTQDQVQARTQLIKFLAKSVDTNHIQALLSLDQRGLTQIHDFTADPKALVAALQQVSNHPPAMNEHDKAVVATGAPGDLDPTPGAQMRNALSHGADVSAVVGVMQFIQQGQEASALRYREGEIAQQTLDALLQIANVYSGIPGRKSLLWVTGGFPFKLDEPTSISMPNLAATYQLTVQRLSDANIAVYPVDARGLVGQTYNPTETHIGSTFTDRSGLEGRVAGQTIDQEGLFESQLLQTLSTVADMTGGRVFTARNDLIEGFNQVDKDGGTYYLLGYYLDAKDTKVGWRKLKVKLEGQDAKLLYRQGFFATPAATNPNTTKALEMAQALHSPIDATGLTIRAKFLGTTANAAKRDVQYLMGANPGSIVPDDKGQIDIEMFGLVVDGKNQPVGQPFDKSFVATLNPDQAKQLAAFGLVDRGTFTLDPGTYTVHFGVRDNKTGRIGTITAPLTVQ